MAVANIQVSTSTSNITVDSTPSNITASSNISNINVTTGVSNINVTDTTTNVSVTTVISDNAIIRNAFTGGTGISYNASTGNISQDLNTDLFVVSTANVELVSIYGTAKAVDGASLPGGMTSRTANAFVVTNSLGNANIDNGNICISGTGGLHTRYDTESNIVGKINFVRELGTQNTSEIRIGKHVQPPLYNLQTSPGFGISIPPANTSLGDAAILVDGGNLTVNDGNILFGPGGGYIGGASYFTGTWNLADNPTIYAKTFYSANISGLARAGKPNNNVHFIANVNVTNEGGSKNLVIDQGNLTVGGSGGIGLDKGGNVHAKNIIVEQQSSGGSLTSGNVSANVVHANYFYGDGSNISGIAGDIESVTAGSGLTGGGTTGNVTLNVGAGNGITVNADNVAVDMSVFSTTDLSEGTNEYFTTARANSAIAGYTGAITNMTGNFTTTGVITGGASATDTHSLTGNLDVTGNITATGNLNYQNVTDLYVTDQKITLNANAATDATVEIIANRPVAGSNTILRWNETDDKWQFTNDGSTYQDLIGLTNLSITTNTPSGNGSLSYNNTTGVFTFTPADVPDNTDELTEGATNLYYTQSRFDTAFSAKNTDDLSQGSTNLYYADSLVDAHLSGGYGITYTGGVIEVTNAEIQAQANIAIGNNTTDNLTEGATNLYFTDARANTVIGTNTTDNLTEGATNLYYTDARSRTAVSVTQASASGNGTLSYDNGTGVFTYTPPDLSGAGLTNAQAQAYIQSNGLTMTADITSSNLIGTTANLDLNSSTAVDNLYGLKWDSAVNKFISSPDAGTTAPNYLFTIEKQGTDLEAIRSRIARSGAFGWKERYEKAEGTLALPTALGNYDETWQAEHAGYDGSTYYDTMGMHVFQDGRTASVSAGIIPLAYEIYGRLDGNTSLGDTNLMSIHADGKIVFNDTGGARGFNTKVGTANISRDGSIVSAADITSRANIVAEANINAAGGTLTGVLTSNSNILISNAFFEGDLNGAVTLDVYNNTGVTLTKGDAVYLTGGNQGDNPHVALADNSVASQMPALGIVRENIGATAIGQVVTAGEMNLPSHGLTLGADLFVSTGGGITETQPTGESGLIQKIGKVVGPNHILIQGAFRSNQVSNLDDGNFFIGNAANQATTASFSSEANTAIAANLAALTSVISSTSNVQINSETDVSGLKGLTFDTSTNNLGLGTATPGAALHIRGTSNESQIYMTEFNGTSSAGVDFRTYRAAGTETTPDFVANNHRIWERFHYVWDGVGTGTDGITSGYRIAIGEQILTEQAMSNTATPVFYQLYNYRDGDNSNNPSALFKARANGDIEFGMPIGSAFDQDAIPATVIDADGNITTSANISTNIILPQSGANVKINDIKPVTTYGNLTLQGNVFIDRAEFEDTGTTTASITAIVTALNQNPSPVSETDSIVLDTFLANGTLVVPSGIVDSGYTEINNGSFYIKQNTGLGLGANAYGLYSDVSLSTPVQLCTSGAFLGSPSGTPIVTYAAGTFTNHKDANLTISGHTSANTLTASANVVAGTGAAFARLTPDGSSANVDVVASVGVPQINLVKGTIGTNVGTFIKTDVTGPTSGSAGSPLVTNAQTIQLNTAAVDANVGLQIFTAGNGVQLLHDGSADEWILNTKADQTFYRVTTTDDFGKNKSYSNTAILALTGMTAGDMVYNSTDNLMAYYDGTDWRNIAQGAIVT